MKFIYYLFALLAGISLSIEGAIYGELGNSIGKLESSFYNFFAGTIIIGIIMLFFGKGSLGYTFKAPKWTLLGGLLGSIYLTILIISIPLVGVGLGDDQRHHRSDDRQYDHRTQRLARESTGRHQ